MSLIKKINDPSGKVYDDISVGALTFDTEPIKGSFNPVTSDGVKKAIDDAVDAILPAGTSQSNPLMNAADTERMIAKMIPVSANTLRFYFQKNDYDPTIDGVGGSGTWKKITKYCNVWDWTASDASFSESFYNAFTSEENLVSVISAGDCSSITSMFRMFRGCTSLISCCLFDSSSVTTIAASFFGCTNLKEIPQFDTSSVIIAEYAFNQCKSVKTIPLLDTSAMTNVDSMFGGCSNVESGVLDLYNQMSTQTTPPLVHSNTFLGCGANTTTGAAELAQIPASWGGTAP